MGLMPFDRTGVRTGLDHLVLGGKRGGERSGHRPHALESRDETGRRRLCMLRWHGNSLRLRLRNIRSRDERRQLDFSIGGGEPVVMSIVVDGRAAYSCGELCQTIFHVDSGMFRLDSVFKSYGDERALDGVSLVIAPGETTVLIGPSGSGKSTLCGLLTGLVKPDAGV